MGSRPSWRDATPSVTVINTQGHPRTGLARVWIDRALLPPEVPFVLSDGQGDLAPVQELQRLGDGSWWGVWARDVPALGWRTWHCRQAGPVAESGQTVQRSATSLESSYLRLELDHETGAIASLYDKELERELVDPAASWQLGRLVHESLLGDRHQLELRTLERCERTPERVSLSAARLSAARRALFLVGGEAKREVVKMWRAGADIPARDIAPALGVDVYVDRAAWPEA